MRRRDDGRLRPRRARAVATLAVALVVALVLSRLLTSGDAVLLATLVAVLTLVVALVASLPLLDRLPRPVAHLDDARLLRRQELVRRLEADQHTTTYVVVRR